MDFDSFSLALVLTGAGATLAGGFVAILVQFIKNVLPENMQTGRAVLYIVYALSFLMTLGGAIEVGGAITPTYIFLFLMSWQAVAGSAVGGYEVVAKAARAVSGTTNPAGPDPQ